MFDFANPPNLGFADLSPEDAARINAFLPSSRQALAPAPPFFLKAVGPERDRAILCLTQAIYYEAALEPDAGQAAVAQTVLNRMRHPAFPKSICGVVYEGSSQPGCQFSFACDGARSRAPMAPFWQRAKAVAERAVNGFVQPDVGAATHYHADYVFPRWGPTLVKITQIGAHIFYRFPGPAGTTEALDRSYAGGELRVSMAGPIRRSMRVSSPASRQNGRPISVYSRLTSQATSLPSAGADPRRNRPDQRQSGGDGQDFRSPAGVGGAVASYQAPIFSDSAWLRGWWARAWSSSASSRTASRAAMQPMPAAVTAWR